MNSRLSRLCEAIIEAGWLAALIVVPLFFNVHSSRVFEPDKLSLLRSIALVMALAWLVKLVDQGRRSQSAAEGEADGPAEQPSLWRRIRGTPLVLPTLALVLVYLVSTVFSLTPRISWWGSYQRLQGAYSTLSYIVIFFLVLGHLRRPEQWQRIVYAMILASLPISIYGILQKTGLDPLPWGGNVEARVASNMGNAIFVAAYLLMAFFLTLQRLLLHFGRLLREQSGKIGLAEAVLAGCYLFVIVVQFLAILYTKSRGPWLGLFAGAYVFILVILLGLRTWAGAQEKVSGLARGLLRWSWVGWVALAVAGVAFLVVFNLPNSPLASLRGNEYIGRLGTAFDFESNTARVRTLIWQGVTELMPPHEPLEYPATGGEGDITAMTPDRANILRPLIGYGPESMWVAFNRFYPPDLAHHENRNASPDRSHNETYDSLVISGLFGFLAYMTLFVSVFYYCLKWLGLIRSHRQRWLFIGLVLVGSLLGALLPPLLQRSWILAGLGLPVGLSLAIILYITLAAIWNESRGLGMKLGERELIIMTVLATIVGHFIEIHFGIAIASTRTYFWVWSAVLVTVGLGWLRFRAAQPAPAAEPAAMSKPSMPEAPAPPPAAKPASAQRSAGSRNQQKRRPSTATAAVRQPARQPAAPRQPANRFDEVLVYALMLGIILFTLAYDYTINPNVLALRETSAFPVFWNSLTSRVENGQRVASLGILWMVVFTWLIGLALTLFGLARDDEKRMAGRWLGPAALLYSAVSGGIYVVFGLIHASTIGRDARVQQPGSGITLDQLSDLAASHIVLYYLVIFLLLGLLSVSIWRTRPGDRQWLGRGRWLGPLAGVGLAVVAVLFISAINVSLVQADIIYKQGQAYESAKQYDAAAFLYQKAIDKQPKEDYYYLFLGRALLESARQATGEERQQILRQAEQALLTAQELNPLNTDHTANLARLALTEAQLAGDADRLALIERALKYYQVTTSLSPNAAHLHNEYGTAYEAAGDFDRALEQFQISQALDQRYVDTYRRLGDFYREVGQEDLAIQTFEQGLAVFPRDVQLHSSLGYIYAQRGDVSRAIEHNLAVVEQRPNDLASNRNLALLFQEAGDAQSALTYAQRALELSQDDREKSALQALIQQLQP